ncbi:MAG: hypothetical protein LBV34_05500 [Nocardiopsaceae bacterium]|jgi:hypothetical protein|nr:hypothetical protein [Nocardiopsaceae bacterium]
MSRRHVIVHPHDLALLQPDHPVTRRLHVLLDPLLAPYPKLSVPGRKRLVDQQDVLVLR